MDTHKVVLHDVDSDPGVSTDFLVRRSTPEGNEHLTLCSTPLPLLLTLGH